MPKKPTVPKTPKTAQKRATAKKTGTATAATTTGTDATLSVLDGSMKSHIRDTFLKRSR